LATRGQDETDFSTTAYAYEAADKLIAELHAAHPELPEKNPNRLMDGFPQLDQFWFMVYTGKDIYIYIYI
jgi:queuine/archaeosine tRNA-ribosyltransferase